MRERQRDRERDRKGGVGRTTGGGTPPTDNGGSAHPSVSYLEVSHSSL